MNSKMTAKRDLYIGSKLIAPKGSTCTIKESTLSDGYSVLSEDGRLLYVTTWWNILADFEEASDNVCLATTWREFLIRC